VADIAALRNYNSTSVSLAAVGTGVIPEKLVPGSNTCLQETDSTLSSTALTLISSYLLE